MENQSKLNDLSKLSLFQDSRDSKRTLIRKLTFQGKKDWTHIRSLALDLSKNNHKFENENLIKSQIHLNFSTISRERNSPAGTSPGQRKNTDASGVKKSARDLSIAKFLKQRRAANSKTNKILKKPYFTEVSNNSESQLLNLTESYRKEKEKSKASLKNVMGKIFAMKHLFKKNPLLMRKRKEVQAESVLQHSKTSIQNFDEVEPDFSGTKRGGMVINEFKGLTALEIQNYHPDDLLLFQRTLAFLKTRNFRDKEIFTEFFQSIKQNPIFFEEISTHKLENEMNKIHFDAIRSSIPEFILLIYLFLGKMYFALGDFTKSREYSKKGLVLGFQINFPKISTKIYKRLIKIYIRKKKYQQAASNCVKLLYFSWFLGNRELEIEVYDKFGLVLYYLGKTKEAKYYHELNCLGKVQSEKSEYRQFGIQKIKEKILKYKNQDVLEAYRVLDSSFEDFEVVIPKEISRSVIQSEKILKAHLSLNRNLDHFTDYENWQVVNNNKNQKFHGIHYTEVLLKNIKEKLKKFYFKILNLEKFLISNKVMGSYDLEMKIANDVQSMQNFSENVVMMRMAKNPRSTKLWKY